MTTATHPRYANTTGVVDTPDRDLALKVAAGRAKAQRWMPYFRTALFAMVEVCSTRVPTAAVDTRWRMYWNPTYIASLTVDEVGGVWLHELSHVLRHHSPRWDALHQAATRHLYWNRGADAALNHDLRDGGITLPANLYYPETIPGAEPGMSAEQFYRIQIQNLLDDNTCPDCGQPLDGDPAGDESGDQPGDQSGDESGDQSGDQPGQPGDQPGQPGDQPGQPGDQPGDQPGQSGDQPGQSGHRCAPGGGSGGESGDPSNSDSGTHGSPSDDCGSATGGSDRPWEIPATDDNNQDGSVDPGRAQRIREQTAREITDHVRSRGTVPGGWGRWASEITNPMVPWDKQLRSIAHRVRGIVAGKRDFTQRRMSRRQGLTPNVKIPALVAPKPPMCAAVLDVSGSVSDTQLGQGLGELKGMLNAVRAGGSDDCLTVLCCDAAASERQSVRNVQQVKLLGGGGTDMRVGIEEAAALRPKMDLIVTFTDGYTPWPEEPPQANPSATYVAVLWDEGAAAKVPDWMVTILVEKD